MIAAPRRASRVHPHQFVADDETPADHRGRHRCSTCGLMGEPGDSHHPAAPPLPRARPLSADVADALAAREAAILGERTDD